MAAWAKYGTFTKIATTTGVQTFSGLTVSQPKGLIIWSTRQTSHAATDGVHMLNGMTDGTDQMCRAIVHPDNEAATTSAQAERYDRIVWFTNATSGAAPTVEVEGQFTAFTATGFSINWIVNDSAATIFHYIAFGGSDVSVDYVAVQITAALQTVSSLSFRPDCFVAIGGASDTGVAYNLGAAFGSMHGFGFSNGTDNVCAWTLGRGTGGASDAARGQHTDRLSSIRAANITGAAEFCSSQITARNSNGFTVARPVGSGSHVPYQHIMAIKGLQFALGSFDTPATATTKTVTLTFQPTAVIVQSHNLTTTTGDGMSLSWGAWSDDGPTTGTSWIGGDDAANPSVYACSSSNAKILQSRTPNATGSSSAVAIEATVQSVSSTGIVFDFTTVPGTPVPVLYIAFAATNVVEEVTFTNGPQTDITLSIGLPWMIVTARSGTQYVWSDRPLPDPSTYYLGFKEPRAIRWGQIRRALSDFLTGQYETTDFRVTLTDTDRVLRQLDADAELVNATVAVYMISDAGRRALEVPRTVYRGVIRDAKPTGTLEYELTIKDTFAEQFSNINETNLIPRRVVTVDDFPNCGQTLVASSAEGYLVMGAVAAGEADVPVDTGHGIFAEGDHVTFGAGTDIYTVVSMSSQFVTAGVDVETYISVDPVIIGGLADNATVNVIASHEIEPAVGKRVPIVYGLITDRVIVSGDDTGDGQGPLLYVGDRVLPDGYNYGEFLIAGHACYSPSNQPIQDLYFWNEAVDNYGNGIYFPDIGTLATEAGVGGRIAIPGYGNWTTTNGITTNYRDYNGRRYTVVYLRGIFKNWALGLTPAPVNLGGVPFAANYYGCEDVGDGSGALITNGLQQYKHAVLNWCPPEGLGYQSGAWLASPTFADDPTLPMIDTASFDTADDQSSVYVTSGYRGDFIIGADDEAISARDLLARFNLSFGVQSGFNRKTQFFVSMINTDIATTTLQTTLDYVRDIFSGTFEIEPLTRELYTALEFRHTQDFFKRVSSGWRSVLSGVTEVENTGATTAYGSKTTYRQMILWFVRGNNRSGDPTDYDRGTDTATSVLALALARLSAIQHLPKLQTGPAGFNYELGDVVPITHYEGLSTTGWTERPVRIERVEIDPSEYTTTLEGYDLDPMV